MVDQNKKPFSLVLEHEAAASGFAAAHFAARLSVESDPSDVYSDLDSGLTSFVVVDARSEQAYEQGHLPGAISLPHRSIDQGSTAHLNKDRLVVVYCWGPACNAAQKAGLRLSRLGFKVKEMIGGFEYWVKEGFPVEGTYSHDPPLYNAHPEPLPA